MTLPNKLTLLRVLLVPVMVIIYYISYLHEQIIYNEISLASIIMVSIFVVASLTDFLDGYLARKFNQVTTFGKFADPLADKLIVMAALMILVQMNLVYMWIVVIILSREFIVSGIRLVAVGEGDVIAASKLGKYKTASTMVAIIVVFIFPGLIADILIYISLALTVISGVDYFLKNKAIILKSI